MQPKGTKENPYHFFGTYEEDEGKEKNYSQVLETQIYMIQSGKKVTYVRDLLGITNEEN